MTCTVCTFYKFVAIEDGQALRAAILNVCRDNGIKGTVLLAPEGVNATVSGTPLEINRLCEFLRADPRFADLSTKMHTWNGHAFRRLKVKLKREIITFDEPEANPAVRVGTYVAPEDWNALISDPDVFVLDTRNSYEVELGTFEGAHDPATRKFGQFSAYAREQLEPLRHRKIAMFCTGGIRCEKASAYLLSLGFPEVYHLRGGILDYLAAVPRSESLWRGTCFVFDERGGVSMEGPATAAPATSETRNADD